MDDGERELRESVLSLHLDDDDNCLEIIIIIRYLKPDNYLQKKMLILALDIPAKVNMS